MWELQVFGMPALHAPGDPQPMRLHLQRAAALLAYLAHHPGPVPRAHLAALLWPDSEPTQARTRLRRLMYTLEETLGIQVLRTDAESLSVDPRRLTTDAVRFATWARDAIAMPALDEATLAAARGWIDRARRPLFEGLSFGSPTFDDWRQSLSIDHTHLLSRLLERAAEAFGSRGDIDTALSLAETLIDLDPYREPSHVLVMQLHARRAHGAGVEAAYTRCAEWLRAEFGIRPSPPTEQAYVRLTEDLRRLAAHRIDRPTLRFARSIAYTIVGDAKDTLVLAPGFVGHIEIALEHPPFRACIESLAERFQVILFDRRGVGLSERLQATSTPAAMAADMAAILDHAGIPAAWIFGSSEGAMGALRLALDHPDRVRGLCLFGALARGSAAPDYPWALPAPAYDEWLRRLVAGWGGPIGIETFAPSVASDPVWRAWWARLVRHAASPGGLETILRGLRDADLRPELARIAVPALVMHRRGDRAVRVEAGEHLARHIPDARWQPLDGDDHFWWCGDSAAVIREIVRLP